MLGWYTNEDLAAKRYDKEARRRKVRVHVRGRREVVSWLRTYTPIVWLAGEDSELPLRPRTRSPGRGCLRGVSYAGTAPDTYSSRVLIRVIVICSEERSANTRK